MHHNLKAYELYERFSNKEDKEFYREKKLESASGHVSFIRKLFTDRKINVLELGSGNSKTLYALEKSLVLDSGYGLEVSVDRHVFAEEWKNDTGFSHVHNTCCDFTKTDLSRFKELDLVFCVDLAFQFAEPLSKGSDVAILSEAYKMLKTSGKIILEFDGCSRIIDEQTGEKRMWEEFSEPDPWRYSLWNCKYDLDKKFMNWKKIFLKRNSNEISESEITIRIYSPSEIREMLGSAGFNNITFYQNWKGERCYDASGEFIVTAEKSNTK